MDEILRLLNALDTLKSSLDSFMSISVPEHPPPTGTA
jgi:hypothetical protein